MITTSTPTKTRYQIVKPLGKGTYGQVSLYLDTKENNRKVAIKRVPIFKKRKDEDTKDDVISNTQRVIREALILQGLNHPNIIQIFDITTSEHPAACTSVDLVLDFMDTDLQKIINSRQKITFDHVEYWAYQILSGLNYLKGAGVVHRDLKPGNLLVNSDCTLRITDFGLAKWLILPAILRALAKKIPYLSMQSADRRPPLIRQNTEYTVTRWYRSPEVIFKRKIRSDKLEKKQAEKKEQEEPVYNYDFPADMWSFGLILLELFYRVNGQHMSCHQGKDQRHQLQLIFDLVGADDDLDLIEAPKIKEWVKKNWTKDKELRLENIAKDLGIPPHAFDLIKKCLVIDPDKRIKVEEALAHPYMKESARNNKESEKEPLDKHLWKNGGLCTQAAAAIRATQLDDERILKLDILRLYFMEAVSGFLGFRTVLTSIPAELKSPPASSGEKKESASDKVSESLSSPVKPVVSASSAASTTAALTSTFGAAGAAAPPPIPAAVTATVSKISTPVKPKETASRLPAPPPGGSVAININDSGTVSIVVKR